MSKKKKNIPSKKQFKGWSLPNKYTTYGLIFALIMGVFAIINWGISEKRHNQEKKENQTSGYLENNKKVSTGFVTIKFGGNEWSFQKSMVEKGINFQEYFSLNGTPEVTLQYEDLRLYVSTKIYDHEDKIVAEIKRNNWEINRNNFYKREFTDSQFEVVDQYNIPLLSIQVRNKTMIEVNGVFINDGLAMFYESDGIHRIIPMDSLSTYLSYGRKLPRIFDYK